MTFRGSKTGENFHNTDVVKVGFASVNYQQRELFFLQLPRTSKKCKLHWFFWSTRSGKVWSWGKAIQDLFLLLLLQGFFSGMLFFLFPSSWTRNQPRKKKKTPTDQTAQIPRRKSRRRRRTLRVAKDDVKPDAKIGSIFWVPRWWRHCAKSGFFFHMKNQNIKTLTFHCDAGIPISLSWVIIWSLYNWVVSSLKIVCELPSANEPSVHPNSSFSIISRRRKMPTKSCLLTPLKN